ncbi:hypothetical protein EDB92DRAFT_1814169 [Lactarius akahatsu]|uniref:Uncharacterized protein n=1 Tax=Lactarius akahatsu TaxID=416441 RepID=A0AAD4LNE8_9AGAM|nr:hypothetical protein EDB92DRAFT_1814169 [Lactarius akahatsu]
MSPLDSPSSRTFPSGPVNSEDPVLQGLPSGSYNPSEALHPSAHALVNGSPQCNAGVVSVVLVRYEDSPVGPYDELALSFHGFANPHQKSTSWRITNTYVSSLQSTWNGRKNWNIPKHLARFKFVSSGPNTSSIEVSLLDAEKPFLTASLTDSLLPAIPILPRIITPFVSIVQPPLVSGLPEDLTNDEWLSIAPRYDGWWKLACIRPSEGGHASYGDGVHFPQFKSFWVGVKFMGTLIVPESAQLRTMVE